MKRERKLPQKQIQPEPWPYDFSRLTEEDAAYLKELLDADFDGEDLSDWEHAACDFLMEKCRVGKKPEPPKQPKGWAEAAADPGGHTPLAVNVYQKKKAG